MSAALRHRSPSSHRAGRGIVAAILGLGFLVAAPGTAAADTCPIGSDVCSIFPGIVPTPLGTATVTVTTANVVTVHLDPTSPAFVIGVPFALPPAPPTLPGYARSSIRTTGGVVDVDTITLPSGPPTRPALPNLAVISIHPPSPCRVVTTGFTVVFTPVPPG